MDILLEKQAAQNLIKMVISSQRKIGTKINIQTNERSEKQETKETTDISTQSKY